jgi:hypothetical protein
MTAGAAGVGQHFVGFVFVSSISYSSSFILVGLFSVGQEKTCIKAVKGPLSRGLRWGNRFSRAFEYPHDLIFVVHNHHVIRSQIMA